MADVLVAAPPELIAQKVAAMEQRKGKPKAGTDWQDVAMLLLTFPELKTRDGLVRERLDAAGASAEVLAAWERVVDQEIEPEVEEAGY